MLEFLAGLAGEGIKFGMARFEGCKLVVEAVACLFVFVAGALVFALLLVELQFTLLELGFERLGARHALLHLPLGVVFDFHAFLSGFEEFVFLEDFGFFSGFVNDDFGAASRH